MIKILFLAANPIDTVRLNLDEEVRAIDLALQQAKFRDHFDLRPHGAVHINDLQELLLRYQPDIVHFSGHGSGISELILQDGQRNAVTVPVDALSNLFKLLKNDIRCVVLNACFSDDQAKAIAQHIDCVVGMADAISDEAARTFAIAFYRALAYGRSVQAAFDLGCSQLELRRLSEAQQPKLIALLCDPALVIFTSTVFAVTSSPLSQLCTGTIERVSNESKIPVYTAETSAAQLRRTIPAESGATVTIQGKSKGLNIRYKIEYIPERAVSRVIGWVDAKYIKLSPHCDDQFIP